MLLWLAGEWLLGFAYGAEFAAAVGIFRLLVLEASLGVLAQVTMQLYLARDRPGLVSAIQGARWRYRWCCCWCSCRDMAERAPPSRWSAPVRSAGFLCWRHARLALELPLPLLT